jgi:hypothetical protein
MTEFHYATDADGVATITWDVPGKSMNVMSMEGFRELDAHIDTALADDAVKGVIITSGKGFRRRHGPERHRADARRGGRQPGARASSTGSCRSTPSCARSSARAWTPRR